MQLMKVAALFDHALVGACPWIVGGDKSRFTSMVRIESEVPRLPVVNIGARLVEDNSRIADGRCGETIPERCRKQRPFAAITVACHTDSVPLDVRQIGYRVPAVRGNI